MRGVSRLAITFILAALLSSPGDVLAGHNSRASTISYRAALAARAEARRVAALERYVALRDAREAEAIARFSRLYGSRVGRWYPLVHKWFPGHESDALYVIRGESGGNPKAGKTNGYHFNGLFQLWTGHAHRFREVTGRAYFWGVFNAEANARYAAYMSDGGRDWSSWSVRP